MGQKVSPRVRQVLRPALLAPWVVLAVLGYLVGAALSPEESRVANGVGGVMVACVVWVFLGWLTAAVLRHVLIRRGYEVPARSETPGYRTRRFMWVEAASFIVGLVGLYLILLDDVLLGGVLAVVGFAGCSAAALLRLRAEKRLST